MSFWRWVSGTVAFALGVGVAATALFSVIYGVASISLRPPLWSVIVVGAVAIGPLAVRHDPVGSPWRVPAVWQRLGHVEFAVLFGVSLGLGFATSLSSIGLVVLVAIAATATSLGHVAVIGVGFAIGRIVPFASVVVRSRNRERHHNLLHLAVLQTEQFADMIRPVELSVLVCLISWLALTSS